MSDARRRIAVVTGTRAEFGLLRSVMRAIRAHPRLELQVIVCGAHLLPPTETWKEVAAEFEIAARIRMQLPGAATRLDDAAALGRGVEGCARVFHDLQPHWVVVVGDRIEAFATASAASVGGVALAHIHGGDRAEGVADEAMRHAITKLAHLHLAATNESGVRIERMGEDPARIHIVGSPAIDELQSIPPLNDSEWSALGQPDVIILHHPIGADDDAESATTQAILNACRERRTLALHPNHDPGRDGVLDALNQAQRDGVIDLKDHLPRAQFVGALKRLAATGGVLVGNSSAGLIEAAALRVRAVNIGPRQAGRERAGNVVDASDTSITAIAEAIEKAGTLDLSRLSHPYGDGRAGERIADVLSSVDPGRLGFLRKRNTY